MLGELRRYVSSRSAERGDEYFAQGRVGRVELTRDGVIEASVQGTRLYNVELSISGDVLRARCDCPWFTGNAEECKHIWAAIRAASAKQLLPDRRLALNIDDRPASNVRPFPAPAPAPAARPARAAWQRFLEALGPAHAASRSHAARSIPDEIAYVLISFARSPTLTIQILGRKKKKGGDWGKWKPIVIDVNDLRELDPFDAESLALLHQRSYGQTVDSTISISPVSTAWWVERLARAGRLFMQDDEGELHSISWDDGPPWVFRTSIVNDASASRYRITGSVEREGRQLPLDRVTAIVHDVIVSGGVAARFDDEGRGSWLYALRASGPIDVPHADTERFRQALLRAPIGDIQLPEELGWELVESTPHPILSLQHDSATAELAADLLFDYDEWRVSSRVAQMQKTIGRKLIRRNRAAEEKLRSRLHSLPVVSVWDGYRVRSAHLEEVVRALINEGWTIEIDSAPLRVSDDFSIEISSGIDWFDLHANASFGGGNSLSLPELLEAAEARRSLVRLADGSFGIVPTGWADSLAPVLELGKRDGDKVRFRSVQALLVDALLRAKGRTADEAFHDLRERIAGAAPEPQQEPRTLRAELRPYQRAGLGWLHFLRTSGIGGCLADDMGLGKTVQTLALLEGIRAAGGKRPSLVVAPRSLLFNWAAEVAKFAPAIRVREHHGSERAKDAESFADCDLVLTTYATMRLDIAHLKEIEFEYVILDEAQAIKNASSQVAKASRLLRGAHRLALTGTPIENHLGELWSLFEFLNPGLLGSSRAFQRTFAAKTVPAERREALARALRPLILRRTKEQVAPELPERIEQTLYCELDAEQRKQYDELRDHYRQALLGSIQQNGIDKSRMQVLEALLRLRQAACDPALIDPDTEVPSAKTELLLDELREVVASGHRALVFSQFTSFLGIVRRELEKEGYDYAYLDGRTRDRQTLVDEFQSSSGAPLFLISLKAGGVGLNLTNADYIFLLDPWWNPAVEAQAIDRAHRIGRMRPVVAYRLIARDTVEEKILELQARKRDIADSIISEDNSVLRRLEVEDLELLLS